MPDTPVLMSLSSRRSMKSRTSLRLPLSPAASTKLMLNSTLTATRRIPTSAAISATGVSPAPFFWVGAAGAGACQEADGAGPQAGVGEVGGELTGGDWAMTWVGSDGDTAL